MKTNLLSSSILTVLVALMTQGCEPKPTEVSFAGGDYVTSSNGHGKGSIFGVNIEIIEAGGTKVEASQVTESSTPVGGAPVESVTTCKIEIGTVQMSLIDSNGVIKLTVNSMPFGEVKKGDSVVVDKTRNVTVNGKARAAPSDEPVPQEGNVKEGMAKGFRDAADHGNAEAQFNLGEMYLHGEGVPKDYIEAYKWATLAAAKGSENGQKLRNELERELTPQQIAEGKRLAAGFVPKEE